MGSWSRLFPNLARHRVRLTASILLALAVSVLWSAELLLTFPVIKVFLQGQHLHEYFESELNTATKQHADWSNELNLIAGELAAVPANPLDASGLSLLNKQARFQRKLNSAARSILWLTLLDTHVISRLPRNKLQLLVWIVVSLILVTATKGVCVYLQDVSIGYVAERTAADLRLSLFRNVMRLDPRSVTQLGAGHITERLTVDIQTIAEGLSLCLGKMLREPLKALGCLIAAFLMNWQLTLISLVFLPPAAWVFQRLGRRLRRATHHALDCNAQLFNELDETIDGARMVLMSNSQREHLQRFQKVNLSLQKGSRRIIWIDAATGPVIEVMISIAVIAAVMPGAYLVLRETNTVLGMRFTNASLDVAELSVMYTLLAGMLDPLRKFSKMFGSLKRAGTSLERYFDLYDRESTLRDGSGTQPAQPVKSAIEFQNVWFQYPGHSNHSAAVPYALQDLTWKIDAGECVAVVGENGSGKSTFAQLLMRFYDPEHGDIHIDGTPLRDLSLRSWRRQIGWGPQDAFLLNDTVAANVAYSLISETNTSPHLTAQNNLLTFAAAKETATCGPGGTSLSGGQRQRVSLARAMARNPSIAILDEPTGAIDPESERDIYRELASFVKNRTTFLITHNMSPEILALTTKVAVFDHGRLVAYGHHQEVLDRSPLYARIFEAQSARRQAA